MKFNRRRFLIGAILASPLLAGAHAALVEPNWVRTRRVRIGTRKPTHRFVQVSDIHHKGDCDFLRAVVRKINALSPEFVCFTGDLIEEQQHLTEALDILGETKSPLYGVAGNHDHWAKVPFDGFRNTFAKTGGAWLEDEEIVTANSVFTITGAACLTNKQPPLAGNRKTRNILLMHYPAWVEKLAGQKFDLMLAGHSHGGQFRVPFFGPLILPFGVGRYDLGMFETASGPLYVNPGIGWFPVPIRFNCRPEITVFEG